jgi:hypothetical protein
MEGTSRRVEREVGVRQGASETARHKLPSFGSRNGGETLHVAIIHYKGNKCAVTMRGLVLPHRVTGFRDPAYKGAMMYG